MNHHVSIVSKRRFFAISVPLILFRRRSLNKVRSCSSWTPHTAHKWNIIKRFFLLFLKITPCKTSRTEETPLLFSFSFPSFLHEEPSPPYAAKKQEEKIKVWWSPPLSPRAAKGKKEETILDLGSAKTPGFLRGGFSSIHSSRVFFAGKDDRRFLGDLSTLRGGRCGGKSQSLLAFRIQVSDETKRPNFRVQRHCLGYLATYVIFETRWVRLHVPHAKTVTKSFAKGSEKEVSVGCSEVVKKSSFF